MCWPNDAGLAYRFAGTDSEIRNPRFVSIRSIVRAEFRCGRRVFWVWYPSCEDLNSSHEHLLRLTAREDLKSKQSCLAGCCELTMTLGICQHLQVHGALHKMSMFPQVLLCINAVRFGEVCLRNLRGLPAQFRMISWTAAGLS